MEKKEYYKHNLPHFQQPGQAYFVTWSLKDAVPKKALKRYTQQLEILKSQIDARTAGAADSDPLIHNADRNRHHPERDANRSWHHPFWMAEIEVSLHKKNSREKITPAILCYF